MREAAWAGQISVGPAASEPWLIELPWCSQTLRPGSGAGSTGASVRRATSSVVSLCGSQISIVLRPHGEVREGHGAGWAGAVLRRSGGHVDGDGVAVRHARPGGQLTVDEEVVQAVRAGRGAHIGPLGAQGVQFDGGGAGAEDQSYAGGLRLDHGQLRIGALGAGPGWQPVGQHAVLGALQLQGAAKEVGGEGVNNSRIFHQ